LKLTQLTGFQKGCDYINISNLKRSKKIYIYSLCASDRLVTWTSGRDRRSIEWSL